MADLVLSEEALKEPAELALKGDFAGAAEQVGILLATAASGHPTLGLLLGKLPRHLLEVLVETNTREFLAAGRRYDDARVKKAELQALIARAVEPLLASNGKTLEGLLAGLQAQGDEHFLGIIRHLTAVSDENTKRILDALAAAQDVERRVQPKLRVAPSRLQVTGEVFEGRTQELELLDGWWASGDTPGTSKVNLVTFVGQGGEGKTHLILKWVNDYLAPRNFAGAHCVFDWSFYSQGAADGRPTSEDTFFDAALRWFSSDPADLVLVGAKRGARLAELIASGRTLLVLDGLEPLQTPPLRGEQAGRLRDCPAMQVLLKELARRNPGLCVVTTRLPIADLAPYESGAGSCLRRPLERLDVDTGVRVLRSLGVNGRETLLRKAVTQARGHAFSLNLLGNYVREATSDRDIVQATHLQLLHQDTEQGGRGARMLDEYVRWLGGASVEVAVLRLLGLFDRPADADCIERLRASNIPRLTDMLAESTTTDERWARALTMLESRLRLIVCIRSPVDLQLLAIDCHPLLREHFGRHLRDEENESWKAAHAELFDHLSRDTQKEPSTLEELQPLFRAVFHGCQSGRYAEALRVYLERVERNSALSSASHRLAAFWESLSALSGFFPEPWTAPQPTLTLHDQATVLDQASYMLQALGRLGAAMAPRTSAIAKYEELGDLRAAAFATGRLSDTLLYAGRSQAAHEAAEKAVRLADASNVPFARWYARSKLANALHHQGELQAARKWFADAEAIVCDSEPARKFLYQWPGFLICNLLLDLECYDEVLVRGSTLLETARQGDGRLVDEGLAHVALGRAHSAKAAPEMSQAEAHLSQGVEILVRGDVRDELPRAYLARAELRLKLADWVGAERDLAEAQSLAEEAGIVFYQVEVHVIEAQRLLESPSAGNVSLAQAKLASAASLGRTIRYRRADPRIASLTEKLVAGGMPQSVVTLTLS
jgi:tetratricopeptide (TPR) repeat protein